MWPIGGAGREQVVRGWSQVVMGCTPAGYGHIKQTTPGYSAAPLASV